MMATNDDDYNIIDGVTMTGTFVFYELLLIIQICITNNSETQYIILAIEVLVFL